MVDTCRYRLIQTQSINECSRVKQVQSTLKIVSLYNAHLKYRQFSILLTSVLLLNYQYNIITILQYNKYIKYIGSKNHIFKWIFHILIFIQVSSYNISFRLKMSILFLLIFTNKNIYFQKKVTMNLSLAFSVRS